MRPRAHTQEPEPTSSGGFHFIWAVIFTLAAVGIWVFLNRGNIQEYLETQKKRDAARENIEVIKSRISELKKQQQSLNANGLEGERQARERWQYHKKGENVIFFIEDNNDKTTTTTPDDPKPLTQKTK